MTCVNGSVLLPFQIVSECVHDVVYAVYGSSWCSQGPYFMFQCSLPDPNTVNWPLFNSIRLGHCHGHNAAHGFGLIGVGPTRVGWKSWPCEKGQKTLPANVDIIHTNSLRIQWFNDCDEPMKVQRFKCRTSTTFSYIIARSVHFVPMFIFELFLFSSYQRHSGWSNAQQTGFQHMWFDTNERMEKERKKIENNNNTVANTLAHTHTYTLRNTAIIYEYKS